MSPDIRRVLGDAATTSSPDTTAILERAWHRTQRQRVAAGVAAVLLLGSGAVVAASTGRNEAKPLVPIVTPTPTPEPTLDDNNNNMDKPTAREMLYSNDVPVPDKGDVRPAALADGTRVLVVHHVDGSLSVVEAVSTHRVHFSVDEQIGWCPGSRSFVEPAHGESWDEWGRYAFGPAPSDLPTFTTTRLTGTPPLARVGQRSSPTVRSQGIPQGTGDSCQGPDARDQLLVPDRDSDFNRFNRNTVLVAHLIQLPEATWHYVNGVLTVSDDSGARFCDGFSGRSTCGPDGLVVEGVNLEEAMRRGERRLYVEVRSWLAQRRSNRITGLVAVPEWGTTPDSQRFGFVHTPRREGGAVVLDIDEALFLGGQAAQLAAALDQDEVPVPNDYYIDNPSSAKMAYEVAPNADIRLIDWATCCEPRRVSTDQLLAHPPRIAHFVLGADGRITALTEQYTP